MNKQLLLSSLEVLLDSIEDLDKMQVSWGNITLVDYAPDNAKLSKKLCYRQLELNWNDKLQKFEIQDTSEPFVCTMGVKECTERGYCNGDC